MARHQMQKIFFAKKLVPKPKPKPKNKLGFGSGFGADFNKKNFFILIHLFL